MQASFSCKIYAKLGRSIKTNKFRMNLEKQNGQKMELSNNGIIHPESEPKNCMTKVAAETTNGELEMDNVQLVQKAYEAMAAGNNFNRLVKGIRILSATPPTILAELTVGPEKINGKNTMHGGCTAALVDILTATSVRLLVPENPIVSIDLSISYLAPIKLGDKILLEATCIKAGKSVAFTDACFRRKADQTILIRARQQLAILSLPTPATKVQKSTQLATTEKTKNGIVPKVAETGKEMIYEEDGSHFAELHQHFAEMGNQNNFYQIASNLEVLHAHPPILAVQVTLGEEHLNNAGTMHGGFTASLVDIVTSRAVSMTDTCPRSSLDLSVSYLLPAKIGDEIIVEGKCLKIGRMMAFTEATFIRKRDGVTVAKGRHNMFMLRPKQVPDSGQH